MHMLQHLGEKRLGDGGCLYCNICLYMPLHMQHMPILQHMPIYTYTYVTYSYAATFGREEVGWVWRLLRHLDQRLSTSIPTPVSQLQLLCNQCHSYWPCLSVQAPFFAASGEKAPNQQRIMAWLTITVIVLQCFKNIQNIKFRFFIYFSLKENSMQRTMFTNHR